MSDKDSNHSAEELIRHLIVQLKGCFNRVGKNRIQISDNKIIDLIFDTVQKPGDPLFAEAFQLLPYIKNEALDCNAKVLDSLKYVFHSAEYNTLNKVVSDISGDFYVWSDYFSFKSIKALVNDHPQMKELFSYKDFDAFFNSMEIYEAALNDVDHDKSIIHDISQFSYEENNILSEYKHLHKIKKRIVTALLQVFSYVAVDANKSRQLYDEIVSFVSDLNYLSEFTKKEDPVHAVVEEFAIYGNTPDYCITDKNTARHILDLADLSVREGNFDNKVFVMLPYIKVTDLHLFRIQQILKSALSPDSEISEETFAIMIIAFERWLPYLTTEHIKYLINIPMLVHPEQESSRNIRLEFKQLLTVMNIIEHVAERKFWHPIYLENLIFSMLNKIVDEGRKIYIRRMAIVASLSIHSNLFRSHTDIYDGYHPYYYDNLYGVLGGMQKVWSGGSHVCLRMLQIIIENDKLFGVYPSEPDPQKQQNAGNIEQIIETIRKNWVQSGRLSVI